MQNQMTLGILYGELIELLFFALAGVWLLYAWPRAVRRQIERKEISEEDGKARLRKLPPKHGYLLMIMGLGLTFADLWQKGFFGYSKLLALVPGAISVGLFIFWLRHRST
jgi:nicotinamide riboside transporter PnuC